MANGTVGQCSCGVPLDENGRCTNRAGYYPPATRQVNSWKEQAGLAGLQGQALKTQYTYPPIDPAYTGPEASNPKDLIGAKKVSLTKIPPVALVHCAAAMMDGAQKYSPYNWREKDVQAGIYVDAALRHLLAWFDREEVAGDSGVHHLGHAMACCAILMDAQSCGALVDNRPIREGGYRTAAVELQKRLEGK